MRFKVGQSRQKLLAEFRAIFLENQTYPHIHREDSREAKRQKLHRGGKGLKGRRRGPRELHTYMYPLHLQRGVEIDGRNIDWLPYPRDSASLFHPPRDLATTFGILRSCMLVVRHPRHYLRPPTSRRYYRPFSQAPCCSHPPLHLFTCARRHIGPARSSWCVYLVISLVVFSRYVSRVINRIGEFPYFPEDITITRYTCVLRLPIK